LPVSAPHLTRSWTIPTHGLGRGRHARRPHLFEIGSELGQRHFEVTRNWTKVAQIQVELLTARAPNS
jgi:hypothetical protein